MGAGIHTVERLVRYIKEKQHWRAHKQIYGVRRRIRPGYIITMLDTYKLKNKALVLSVKGSDMLVHYVG